MQSVQSLAGEMHTNPPSKNALKRKIRSEGLTDRLVDWWLDRQADSYIGYPMFNVLFSYIYLTFVQSPVYNAMSFGRTTIGHNF